jgi:hypothetical protein
MTDRSGSTFWAVAKFLFFGWALAATASMLGQETLSVTRGVRQGRWWLISITVILWMLMLPIGLLAIAVVVGVSALIGYFMDAMLLTGIDNLYVGNTTQGMILTTIGALFLLGCAGYIFELLRRNNPDSPGAALAMSIFLWLLFAGCGLIPYLICASTSGLPVMPLMSR